MRGALKGWSRAALPCVGHRGLVSSNLAYEFPQRAPDKREVIGDAVTLATLCAGGEWREGEGEEMEGRGQLLERGQCRRVRSPLKE